MNKADNYIQVVQKMAGWTILQRIRFVAQELQNLYELVPPLHAMDVDHELLRESSALESLALEDFKKCLAICDGNWEPPC